jgi:hypothetical protein
MKVVVGLLNVPAVADSWENVRNPNGVGMLDPTDGGENKVT